MGLSNGSVFIRSTREMFNAQWSFACAEAAR